MTGIAYLYLFILGSTFTISVINFIVAIVNKILKKPAKSNVNTACKWLVAAVVLLIIGIIVLAFAMNDFKRTFGNAIM